MEPPFFKDFFKVWINFCFPSMWRNESMSFPKRTGWYLYSTTLLRNDEIIFSIVKSFLGGIRGTFHHLTEFMIRIYPTIVFTLMWLILLMSVVTNCTCFILILHISLSSINNYNRKPTDTRKLRKTHILFFELSMTWSCFIMHESFQIKWWNSDFLIMI